MTKDNNLWRNLFLLLTSIVTVAGCLYIGNIIVSNIKGEKINIIGPLPKYYNIINEKEINPDLIVIDKEVKPNNPIINTTGSKTEIKVQYLGVSSNFDSFKIVECGSVQNCNLNLVIKLNRSKQILVNNKLYFMDVVISSNLSITNNGLREAL